MNSKNKLLFSFVFSCLTFLVLDVKGQGSVILEETGSISTMMEKFVKFNLQNGMVDGYRIQIITTTDRREMDEARKNFLRLFPSLPITWKHIAPNYQVRVGAYWNKNDAISAIHDIRRHFPMSTPVSELIDKKEFLLIESNTK
jgi:hypothetical protein